MSKPPALTARPDLGDVEPYVSPQLPARYRLNTNESPFPPPPELLQDICEQLAGVELNRYPRRDADELVAAIAAHADRPANGVWVANGSNEVLLHLFLTFGGPARRVLVFEPTYSLHSLIARIAGTPVEFVARPEGYSLSPEFVIDAIERTSADIVMLCSPNNPTGACESRATVQAALEVAPGLVVVDEAYIEFAGAGKSVADLMDAYSNLVITRSFSKAWRLAGARLGYLLAGDGLVDELRRVRLPYHLSSFTQIAGAAILQRHEETVELARRIVEQRNVLALGLDDLGLRTYPSDANFVLFEIAGAHSVWDALLGRGVLVRDYSESLGDHLRVTAGLPEETRAFLEALEHVLGARIES